MDRYVVIKGDLRLRDTQKAIPTDNNHTDRRTNEVWNLTENGFCRGVNGEDVSEIHQTLCISTISIAEGDGYHKLLTYFFCHYQQELI